MCGRGARSYHKTNKTYYICIDCANLWVTHDYQFPNDNIDWYSHFLGTAKKKPKPKTLIAKKPDGTEVILTTDKIERLFPEGVKDVEFIEVNSSEIRIDIFREIYANSMLEGASKYNSYATFCNRLAETGDSPTYLELKLIAQILGYQKGWVSVEESAWQRVREKRKFEYLQRLAKSKQVA